MNLFVRLLLCTIHLSIFFVSARLLATSPDPNSGNTSLARGKEITASSTWGAEYEAKFAVDANEDTRWNAAENETDGAWLAVDFGKPVQFDLVTVDQYEARITSYRLQNFVNGTWQDVYTDTAEGKVNFAIKLPQPVESSKVRLLIVTASKCPSIREFKVLKYGSASITLNGSEHGPQFQGVGALSAGASSRLLIDYPEKQRSEILDFLFKPNFGAALQINKVEIGGDMNSTDGSEPSHMRTREEENYQRGYEWWLMEESKKRNADVKLFGLEWGAPNWINPNKNNVWTSENIDYLIKWISHSRSDHNLTIDYIGGWNERSYNKAWYEDFHKALVKGGFSETQIVADDSFDWNVGKAAQEDPEFARSFEVIGEHYPGIPPSIPNWILSKELSKPLWGSEIGSKGYDDGAANLAKTYNDGCIDDGITAFINWSTIWSVLPGMPYNGAGLMLANEPWSGHYQVGLSIWATAHTTQFVQPGWQYLPSGCGHFGDDRTNGSYVTLRSPDQTNYSVIVETADADCAQTATFKLTKGLSKNLVHVWKTNLLSEKDQDWFIRQPDIQVDHGSFSFNFEPACIYSLTTTAGQAKGVTSPPPHQSFPIPYSDTFQAYSLGKTPRYFSDQHGAFEIARAPKGRSGNCLRQVITAPPVYWNSDTDPGTLIGDSNLTNYTVSIDVLLERSGYVDLVGRFQGSNNQNRINGYHLRLENGGRWSLFVRADDKSSTETVLQSGTISSNQIVDQWHRLSLCFKGTSITASIDGRTVTKNVSDSTYSSGLAGLQVSRWENADFMNFDLQPN